MQSLKIQEILYKFKVENIYKILKRLTEAKCLTFNNHIVGLTAFTAIQSFGIYINKKLNKKKD